MPSRLAYRSADIVLRDLDDRLRTLRHTAIGGPLRRQTLLSTLERSYALLTGAEAPLLRSASIFAGPFDGACAADVVAHLGMARRRA